MMYKQNTKSKALKALTSAALAIPIVCNTGLAKKAVDDSSFGYRFSSYAETDFAADSVFINAQPEDGEDILRSNVGLHQFQLLLPFSSSFQFDLDVKSEVVSGATAIYLRPAGDYNAGDAESEDNEPVAVFSDENDGDDTRTQIAGTGTLFFNDSYISFGGGVSSEDDYFALSFNGSLTMEFNNDNTAVTVGGHYNSVDIEAIIENANPDYVTLAEDEDLNKTQFSIFAEVSQVFTANLIARAGGLYSVEDGYLSDPYKLVYVAGNDQLVSDSRPDTRTAVAAYTDLRYFVDSANGAVHLDYRFHFDNWRMTSHSFELGWYQGIDDFFRMFDGGAISSTMGDAWDMALTARYYTQSKAFFYEHYYVELFDDGFQSSDYRLSDFGSFSYGIRVERQFTNWKLFAGVEQYISSQTLAFSTEETFETPALVDWTQLSVGVELKFK